jgi:hypothetical protein
MGTLFVGIYRIHGPRDDARIVVELLMNWKGDFKIVLSLGMPFPFPCMVSHRKAIIEPCWCRMSIATATNKYALDSMTFSAEENANGLQEQAQYLR